MMLHRSSGVLIFCLIAAVPALAGDTATFVSLGWSQNSGYYAFAQHGYLDGSGFPYAEVHVLDAAKNLYVPGGVSEVVLQDVEAKEGVALTRARAKMRPILRTLGFRQGTGADTGAKPECVTASNELLSRCTVISPRHGTLTLTLKQASIVGEEPTSNATKASFSLALEGNDIQPLVLEDGKRKRVRVLDYGIHSVSFSPDGQHIAVILSKREAAFEGPSIRYMADVGRITGKSD